MDHVWVLHEGRNCEYGCLICDGGLAVCAVCRGVEGSLTTDCCGERLEGEALDAIYRGFSNFVGGIWVCGPSTNSPAYYR